MSTSLKIAQILQAIGLTALTLLTFYALFCGAPAEGTREWEPATPQEIHQYEIERIKESILADR